MKYFYDIIDDVNIGMILIIEDEDKNVVQCSIHRHDGMPDFKHYINEFNAELSMSSYLNEFKRYISNPMNVRFIDVPTRYAWPVTILQKEVFREISNLYPGQTITYGELAERVGRPNAWRAVATACGNNPFALIVPCHRTVPASGKVGGFAWGENVKRILQQREGIYLK